MEFESPLAQFEAFSLSSLFISLFVLIYVLPSEKIDYPNVFYVLQLLFNRMSDK